MCQEPGRTQTKCEKTIIRYSFELSSDKDFKTAVKKLLWLTIINIPEKNEQIESLDKAIEDVRKVHIEIKNKITDIKNSIGGINSRTNKAGGKKISELD